MDIQYLLFTFVLWCFNTLFLAECNKNLIKNWHTSRHSSSEIEPYTRLLTYLRQTDSKTLLHKRFFEFNPYYHKQSASSDSNKRVVHPTPVYAYRGTQGRVKTKTQSMENDKLNNDMSIVDHFSGVRTVFTLYLKLLHLTENIKTDELYHKSANVDATKSAQSFSTLMDGEQKATTFITTRAFEKLNGDVNINLDLGTFVEGFGLPDGATQNNDLVAHSNNHMHYLEKHVHVNEILNTKTETLSSANDVPIHQNVANNIQNNSLISTESIQNNITVLQTVTENVTGSNQTINIFGGSQQVLPDKLKQEYFESENATFESTQRATSSDILDPNEHNLNPVLEQQHNEKYQNAAVLPDGFLSNDEMQSLYGSNMYENYDISSQEDGFGGFNNAPIASEPEEGTHHGGIKSDDAFVYANNKGGFSAIGSFNSVKDDCEDIETRACFLNTDCSCYGLFVCSDASCQLVGNSQETGTISDGYWLEGPVDIPTYN